MTCTRCGAEYWQCPQFGNMKQCDPCMSDASVDAARAQAEITRNAARAAQQAEWAKLLHEGAQRGWSR
jgi:hypothetical protein